ncbi:MAG: hypothetical protein HY232_13105 [Acidobacteria bacterium]|nr:hypothetical protein [Acidobacteriota bacterium]
MNWFKENSSAIQAFASIVGLVVTIILACLTYRYVRLTKKLVDSSLEQTNFIKESSRIVQKQNAQALKALALNLRTHLTFPLSHTALAAFNMLTEHEITNIESSARQVDNGAIPLAVEAVAALRVIYGMIQVAKSIPKNMGWMPTEQETKNWAAAISTSHRNLQALESICEQVTKT